MDKNLLYLMKEKGKGLSNQEYKEKMLFALSDNQSTSGSTVNLDDIYGGDFSQVLVIQKNL